MTNQYSRYGLTSEDIEGPKAWEAYGRRVGLSRSRVEDGLKWYGRNRDRIAGMDTDQIVQSFTADTARTWSEPDNQMAAKFYDDAVTHGDYSRFMPRESDSKARLAELDKMVGDANSEYYTGINSADLRAEHLALLEQLEGMGPSEQSSQNRPDNRLSELEAMMKDPSSDYYSSPDLRHEYLDLLAAQSDDSPALRHEAPAENDGQSEPSQYEPSELSDE